MMKKGNILFPLLGIVAVGVVVGGFLWWRHASGPLAIVPSGTPQISITGITPSSGPVGTTITITGVGFSKLVLKDPSSEEYGEGDYLTNGKVWAYLGGQVVNDNTIVATIGSQACPADQGACSSAFSASLAPGMYSVYVQAGQGSLKSNTVPFTVTAKTAGSGAVFAYPDSGISFRYDPKIVSVGLDKDPHIVYLNLFADSAPSGDYFQVFNKNASTSFIDAVKALLSQTYTAAGCVVKSAPNTNTGIPYRWNLVAVYSPDHGTGGSNCSTQFENQGAPAYFLYDASYPSRFLFWRGGAAIDTKEIFSTLRMGTYPNL